MQITRKKTTSGNKNGVEIKKTKRTKTTAFCYRCQHQVELLTFAKAANFCFTTPKAILKLADRSKLHRLHNRRGTVMICQSSLEKIRNISFKREIVLLPIGFINQTI